MAWAERTQDGRWRGCYRDSSGQKHYVTDDGRGYESRQDALEDAEVMAERAG